MAANLTPSASSSPADRWVNVGPILSFTQTRTRLKVQDRHVALIRIKKRSSGSDYRYICFDAVCYHMGGPLYEGKLINVEGRTCIKCPWHSYIIDLDTGEGLYMDIDGRYETKGARQRIHQAEAREDGNIYIRLNLSSPQNLASDEYAYDKQDINGSVK